MSSKRIRESTPEDSSSNKKVQKIVEENSEAIYISSEDEAEISTQDVVATTSKKSVVSFKARKQHNCIICGKQMRIDNLKSYHIKHCILSNKTMLIDDVSFITQVQDWLDEIQCPLDLTELLTGGNSYVSLTTRKQIEMKQQLQNELEKYSLSDIFTYIKSPKNTAEDIMSSLTQVKISQKFFTEILKSGGLRKEQKFMEEIIREDIRNMNTRLCSIFLDKVGGIGKSYLSQYLRAITVLDCGYGIYDKKKTYFLLLTSTSIAHQASIISEVKDAIARYGIDVKLCLLLNLPRAYNKYDIANLEEIMEGIWRYSYKSPVFKTFMVKVFIFCNTVETLQNFLSRDRFKITDLNQDEMSDSDLKKQLALLKQRRKFEEDVRLQQLGYI